jgi:hypothetical protein
MDHHNITVICLTRHGHGTTGIVVDSLLKQRCVPARVIIADTGAPEAVAERIRNLADQHTSVEHLHFAPFVSRQQARIKALQTIETEYTLVLDNNILLGPDAIEKLLARALTTSASLVSPVIVSLGGAIHYSGAKVIHRRRRQDWMRRTTTVTQHVACPVRTPLSEARLQAVETDWVESHCALARTDELRRPGALLEDMHNAHTMCYASCYLKQKHGATIYFEPGAIASIVPVGFGYDLPWMLLEYMDEPKLDMSYRTLGKLIGRGPAADYPGRRHWHAKHFKYLAHDMVAGGRLDRDTLLTTDELPERVAGYDNPLPDEIDESMAGPLTDHVAKEYPVLHEPLQRWLHTPHHK